MQLANLFVGIVTLVQIIIFVVEIFFWKEPIVHQRLGFTLEEAIKAAPIVANAGLYNGFLAAGLIWGLVSGKARYPFKVFFLICIMIAGIFGAATLKWTTLLIQTVPAAIALLFVWIANKDLGNRAQQVVK